MQLFGVVIAEERLISSLDIAPQTVRKLESQGYTYVSELLALTREEFRNILPDTMDRQGHLMKKFIDKL